MNIHAAQNQGHPLLSAPRPQIEASSPMSSLNRPVTSTNDLGGARTGGPLYFDPKQVQGDRPAFSAREAAQRHHSRPVLSAADVTRIADDIKSSLAADRPRTSAEQPRASADPSTAGERPEERDASEAVAKGQITDQLVGEIMQKLDLDQDQVITAKEAPFSDQAFEAIDADKDGAITGNELYQALNDRYTKAASNDPTLSAEAFAMSFLFGASGSADILTSARESQSTAPIDQRVPFTDQHGNVHTHPVAQERERPGTSAPDRPTVEAGSRPVASASNDRAAEAEQLSPSQRLRLQEIARKIAERLDDAGHTNQPPTNIQDVVRELGLNNSSEGFLMRLLNARFPQGLGVSMFG